MEWLNHTPHHHLFYALWALEICVYIIIIIRYFFFKSYKHIQQPEKHIYNAACKLLLLDFNYGDLTLITLHLLTNWQSNSNPSFSDKLAGVSFLYKHDYHNFINSWCFFWSKPLQNCQDFGTNGNSQLIFLRNIPHILPTSLKFWVGFYIIFRDC